MRAIAIGDRIEFDCPHFSPPIHGEAVVRKILRQFGDPIAYGVELGDDGLSWIGTEYVRSIVIAINKN